MSSTGAISTLIWVLIAIIILVVIVVIFFKVINMLFIMPQIETEPITSYILSSLTLFLK